MTSKALLCLLLVACFTARLQYCSHFTVVEYS